MPKHFSWCRHRFLSNTWRGTGREAAHAKKNCTKMQIKIIKLLVVKDDINSLYKAVLASVYGTFLSGTRYKRQLRVVTQLKGHCSA